MSETAAFTFGDRSDRKAVETGFDFSPKFDEHGLIPAIAQDAASGQVLMVAYMNADSLRATIECGEAVYFSRSRQELWHKGATSGHVQTVHEILTDCDQDALVIKVTQHGPGCCHAGYQSCFYRSVPKGETAETAAPLTLKPVYSEQSYDPSQVYK
jgi:phosphoribosyl-AMP cyclohydrolase